MKSIENRLHCIRVFLLISIVLVFLMVYSIYRRTESLIFKQFDRQQYIFTSRIASSIQDFFTDIENELLIIAEAEFIQNTPDTDHLMLIEHFADRHQPDLERILKVDASGRVIRRVDLQEKIPGGTATANINSKDAKDFSDDPLFKAAAFQMKPTWKTLAADQWGTRTVSLAVPIIKSAAAQNTTDSYFGGAYIVFISGRFLISNYLLPANSDIDYYSWVINDDGRILIHTTLPDLLDMDSLEESSQEGYEDLHGIIKAMLRGERGTGTYTYRGERKYMAYVPVNFGDIRWSMAISMPISEMIAPIRLGYRHNFFFFWAIVISFTILATLAARTARQSIQRKIDLEQLYSLRTTFATSTTSEELLNKILDKVVQLKNIETAILFLLDDKTGILNKMGSRNIPDRSSINSDKSDQGKGPEYQVLIDKKPIVIEDKKCGWLTRKRGASSLFIPIVLGDDIIGVLNLSASRPGVFNEEYISFIEALAEDLSVILNNISLFQLLRDKTILLKRANQVKTEFLSMVSHELRTPLSVVIGFLSLLCDGRFKDRPDEMMELSRIADQRARDLEKLISNLLNLTCIEEGKIEIAVKRVDPKKIVHETHRLSLPQAEKKMIKLDLDLPRKIPPCLGDPDKIKQIMDNLMNNAIKFSPPGGLITIKLGSSDGRVLFSVSDNGPGIPSEKLKKIFERFYQVDSSITRNYSGSGLGLAISKELARLQDGKLWAENRESGGTTFYLSLPSSRTIIKKEKSSTHPGTKVRQTNTKRPKNN